MLTAIYVRVSHKSQDTRAQESELQRWADAQDCEIRWYRDKATGTKMERPAFDRLLADIHVGQVDRVVIWRIDRLGRTAAGLTKLFADLQDRKVNLVSLKDGLDLATPAGRLMANMLASVAQFETEARCQRVAAGIAAAKAAGKRWGGSKAGRRLSVTDEQAAMVKQLHGQRKSKAEIARTVGVSRPTVYRLLAC